MPNLLERLKAALEDRYTVKREIGRGGMATVFLAEDLKHNRKVAIKVLLPDLAASLGGERFLREIEISAGLNHPHILVLYDSGEADGLLYFVMPYVEGESLRDRLERDQYLTVEEALEVARQVADALEHAHAHGVVHRDIKPANIMLAEGGALVMDFGVAKAVAAVGETKLTRAGLIAGTPDYMSPEQASGQEIDARSDLYSLGCVLYEMLGGEPPLTGPTAQAILARRMAEVPTPLGLLRDTVPRGVDYVTQRLLAKLPIDRYASAAELSGALEDALQGRIEVPAPVSPKHRMHRALIAGLGAGLVLVLVWGATVLFPRGPPDLDPQRVAVLPLENRTGDSDLDHVGQDLAERIGDVIRREGVGSLVPAVDLAAAVGSTPTEMGASTGAGRVVSGGYSRDADSLRFRVVVTSSVDAVELGTATSVAPVTRPSRATSDIEEQVAVIFLMLSDEKNPSAWVPLPALESYRTTREAIQLFDEGGMGVFNTAVAAARQDPGFLLPRLYAYARARDSTTADSVWRSISPRRQALPPDWLTWLESLEVMRGLGPRDSYASDIYRATGRQTEALPSNGTYWWHAVSCMDLNRPGEAIAAHETAVRLATEDPTSLRWTSCASCARASVVGSTDAYHALGKHEEELNSVRVLLELDPEDLAYRYLELRAFIGLERLREAEAGLDALASLSHSWVGSPGRAISLLGMSLRQHGHIEAAERVMQRAIRWHAELPGEQAGTYRSRVDHAFSLYQAGRWPEARAVLDALDDETPATVQYAGLMARIAARLGDRAAVAQHEETLQQLDASTALLRGQPKLELARISALMNDRAGALTLLRQAVAEGAGRDVFVLPSQIALDFANLVDYEPYREFMRPKG